MDNDDQLKNREIKREYLENWLNRLGQAEEIVPKVQRELEKTTWEIEALSNRPEEASEIPIGEIPVLFDNDLKFLGQVLPMLPAIDASLFSSSDAISTSGTASVYEYISRIGDVGTSKAFEFSNFYTTEYQRIQIAHDLPHEIRKLLEKLPTEGTLERFNRAEKFYMQFKAGVGEKTSASMEMRTFADGLPGDLFQIARKWKKENMTWEKMAERISKGGKMGYEYQEMIRQKNVHSSLISRLSEIGKDREGGSLTNLDHVWTELLDHVFTLLNIANL